jgi:hypothetical protein
MEKYFNRREVTRVETFQETNPKGKLVLEVESG